MRFKIISCIIALIFTIAVMYMRLHILVYFLQLI